MRRRLQPLVKSTAADAHPLVGACNDPATVVGRPGRGRASATSELTTVGHLARAWGRTWPTFALGLAGRPHRPGRAVAPVDDRRGGEGLMGFATAAASDQATGGVGRGGRGTGGGWAASAAAVPSADFEPVPKERRGQTIRRILVFFRPYRLRSRVVLVAILLTSLLGLINPLLLKLLIDDAIPQRGLSSC